MQHIFMIGAKSMGMYGGYETFVYKLTEYHRNNNNLKYHIAVKANGIGAGIPETAERYPGGFSFHNAECFEVRVPQMLFGGAQAIYYDCAAFHKAIEIIRKEKIQNPAVYVMTCRIGPFFRHYANIIRRLGGKLYLNPDGHEWMRDKWPLPVKKYWKYSEKQMVLNSDLIVCDSRRIEEYIQSTYGISNTETIAYGAETERSRCRDEKLDEWLKNHGLERGEYFLNVGRLVPENSYETMIKEFMRSTTNKNFVLVSNTNPRLLDKLNRTLRFSEDCRIRFVGSIYDQELLKKIREEAFANFHGHKVGGTNPSLLEALASTKLNLVLKNEFNEEVAGDAALYWTEEDGSLARLINHSDLYDREKLGACAKERINTFYSWRYISDQYEQLWTKQ